MSALFLAPHHDDAALFGAYLIQMFDADVVVVYESRLQEIRGTGVTNTQREVEERKATRELNWRTPKFLRVPDDTATGDVGVPVADIIRIISPDIVIAPVVEEGGHVQHNLVGACARSNHPNVIGYYTYTNGRQRNGENLGFRVPIQGEWIAPKLRAMACYTSQHMLWSTAHHFTDHPLHEWTDRELA